MRSKLVNVLTLLLLGSLIGGGTFAAAQTLISSRDIRDRSIQNRDIRPGVITLNRLTPRVRNLIRNAGPQGPRGAPGEPGGPGEPGTQPSPAPTLTRTDFGVIDRLVFGSPVAQLRFGPGDPPAGNGSLGLLVAGGPDFPTNEKISYGVLLRGELASLRRVGFSVFTTAANIARAGGNANMPNIQFEIHPQASDGQGAITFSTLVFNPVNTAANEWTTIDATDPDAGRWSLTGRAGTLTGCSSPSPTGGCELSQIKARLPEAVIFTAIVNKGRDFEWQGAVDAVRVNGRIADFEADGVVVESA